MKGRVEKYLYSDQNIFHAVYATRESIQEKFILEKRDKDKLYELYDVFDEVNIRDTIRMVKERLEEVLEKDKYFQAKVYFIPKSIKEKKEETAGTEKKYERKYRPMHTAGLIDQICMTAMLNCIITEDFNTDEWNIGGIEKIIPANFYGNILSEIPDRVYKKWQPQYSEYTQKASELQKKYSDSREYQYEISVDITDFFPSINPYYIICYIMNRLPVRLESRDRQAILNILIKLLFIKLDTTNLHNSEFLKIYYSGHVPPKSQQFVRGVAQGLIPGYFFANIFMIEVSKVYKKVFEGKQLFYVDDTVIFSNKLRGENNLLDAFDKIIQGVNADIEKFINKEIEKEPHFIKKEMREFTDLQEYKVLIHSPKEEDSKTTYIDLGKLSRGELFLGNLGRMTSMVAVDLNTDFNSDEMVMLEQRLKIIVDQIEKELNSIADILNNEIDDKFVRESFTNYKKRLLRYKKYFKYRYFLLQYRKNFSFDKIIKFIKTTIDDIEKEKKDNNLKEMFETYSDDILTASISFLIRNLGNDKNYKKEFIIENEIKLREEIRKLNDYLFEEQNETSSYLYRAFEDYIDMDSEEEDVCRSKRRKRDRELQKKKYESLVKKVNLKLPNTRTISEERLKEFVEKYLTEIIENTELIYSILDDPVQMKNIYSLVESRTNEIKRMVINSSISYLYNVSISDEFDFSKQGNRALKYSELRLLAILRNKSFSIDILKKKKDEILQSEERIDYSILEVVQYFKTFVKNYEYIDQLICVHKYTSDLWKNGSKYLYFYTLHNQEHAIDLIKNSIEMVRAINYFKLKKIDYFILFAACYLHDISMVSIPDLDTFQRDIKETNMISVEFSDELDKENLRDHKYVKKMLTGYYKAMDVFFENLVRSNHAKESGRDIRNAKELDFLGICIKEIVAEVSEAHGYHWADVYRQKSVAREMTYSLKYMQIILRLSDLLDMKKYRVSKPLLSKNIENMSPKSAFHWISHIITNNLRIKVLYTTQPGNVDLEKSGAQYHSFLTPGRIIEKIRFEIHLAMMPDLSDTKIKKCQGIQMKIEPVEDIEESEETDENNNKMRISFLGQENSNQVECDGGKCNMACKWFTVKNAYLVEELCELRRYLHDTEDNFFTNNFEIVLINDNDNDSVITPKQLDIVGEFISSY